MTKGPLSIRSVKHPMEHNFVVSGDPKDPDTAVVADPWPTLAQAVLLKDHFVSKGDLVGGTLDAADARPAAKVVVNQNEMPHRRRAKILGTIGKIEASSGSEETQALLKSLDGYCD